MCGNNQGSSLNSLIEGEIEENRKIVTLDYFDLILKMLSNYDIFYKKETAFSKHSRLENQK